jgi:hypothetical protein
LHELLAELNVTFAPDLLIEAGGKKYGFLSTSGLYIQAEATLWNVTAISMAMNRPRLIVGEERKRLEQRLAEV